MRKRSILLSIFSSPCFWVKKTFITMDTGNSLSLKVLMASATTSKEGLPFAKAYFQLSYYMYSAVNGNELPFYLSMLHIN